MQENTKIIQCCIPPMVAGNYEVSVSHSISNKDNWVSGGPDNTTPITKTFKFGVEAARFKLNPADIYSVYPPAGQTGLYKNSLPHIVFSRRTLPWERTLDGEPPVFQRQDTPADKKHPETSPPVPWMALILLTRDEMMDCEIKQSTTQDLIQPATPGITRPEIEDAAPTGCFTIDIPKQLFERHIPSLDSLPYLAHAKEVLITHKDKEGIVDKNDEETGVFSVVIGNCLPQPGQQHTALLVSLEGYTDYLRDGNTPAKKTIPDLGKARLALLANWAFTDSGQIGFKELLDGLEKKSLKIDREQENEKLIGYFNAGYTPLQHQTRNGTMTLSWYHGPFLPRPNPKIAKPLSFSSPDACLRYDPDTGLFDVSYAAAWQLGRMLALQSKSFSANILKWRLRQKTAAIKNTRRSYIENLPGIATTGDGITIKDKLINYIAQLNQLPVQTNTQNNTQSNNTPKPDTTPVEITAFLDDLLTLKGVPFNYLVPDEYLLQKEHTNGQKEYTGTIAFFYVDPAWLETLLDGALSIYRARPEQTETLLSQAMTGQFTTVVDQNDPNAQGQAGLILNVTGFMLRSNLIAGWRGVEIRAYDEKDTLLPALRLERIDNDIFLGIFNGNVSRVEIIQPYEGLHFGIDQTPNGYEKETRPLDGSTASDANKHLFNISTLLNNNHLIADRIVDIAKLAASIKDNLSGNGFKTDHFTAAEFAYQMIASPVKYEIKINLIIDK